MTALSFTLKIELKQRVDLSPLTPDLLANQSLSDISAIALQSGNRKLQVDEVFTVTGTDTQNIQFLNSNAKLDYIGKAMSQGTITVTGDAGAYLGMHMKNGAIKVSGSVGAYAACELKNGTIEINSNAGDYLGAAQVGNKKGMQGGIVIVKGNAGDRVGDHMRRGVILIEGTAGGYLGARMTAGTIAVMGDVGVNPGYAMRRGTLLLLKAPQRMPVTFNDCGSHTLGFLPLLLKSFKAYPTKFAGLADSIKRVQRYAGDLSGLGKGEILIVI